MTLSILSDPETLFEALLKNSGIAELKADQQLSISEDIAGKAFTGIVGRSFVLRRVLKLVEMVAASDATVLLLGETGTGKELIARAIHERSRRQKEAFLTLNCAAIPSSLFESELFGHERGAFTGAYFQKVGRLELADRGTMFSTTWVICRLNCSPNSCVPCRSVLTRGWVARGPKALTYGWWRRLTAI